MTRGVLAHGDGLVMSVASSSEFLVDQEDFEHHAFTPYAVLDPGSGWTYETLVSPPNEADQRWQSIPQESFERAQRRYPSSFHRHFRTRLGASESAALVFVRKEQRVRLLNRLCGGIEIAEGEYVAQCLTARSTSVTEIWRLSDLFWRVASSGVGLQDFPSYLEKRFLLRRATAWTLAWALLRGAYLDEDDCIYGLIGQAEMLRHTGGSESSNAAKAAFEERVRAEVERLKQRALS